MALFEITISGSKTFYIDADTEEDALDSDIMDDEMLTIGDFEWEADTGTAIEMTQTEELRIRKRDHELIVQV